MYATISMIRRSAVASWLFCFFVVACQLVGPSWAFVITPGSAVGKPIATAQRLHRATLFASQSSHDAGGDSSELVARRIVVKGDVQGGYYRSCVLNEVSSRDENVLGSFRNVNKELTPFLGQAGRFRRLVGTMTPPDDTDTAEIYVEGKRKMVDGFVRWCKKGNVGLSQVVHVQDVLEEEPTGLYDEFYVKVRGE